MDIWSCFPQSQPIGLSKPALSIISRRNFYNATGVQHIMEDMTSQVPNPRSLQSKIWQREVPTETREAQ